MRRPPHRWTKDEDATLVEMTEDGSVDSEVAVELGLETWQVKHRRMQLELLKGSGAAPDVERRLRFIAGLEKTGTVDGAGRHAGINTASSHKMAVRLVRDGLLRRVPNGKKHRYVVPARFHGDD